ncbi:ketopantoate reductase family protein [Mycolicibacterium septicum DSM 44393]|uniref:Ketopantoate reductase family protein n=1 Tax=Mycolicibacterium septicum DSM 44393 TaxID=1341646 RepID=A0A7X6MQ73_9MYCO|nr:FAD-dependent oxidoreductase [Mycolicibacterium septicum]NKZ10844.1 ketopantoate reductase family protein [Mycolicibacterium septicum DSM 44393]
MVTSHIDSEFRVAVVGAGSIGSAFAFHLARAGHDVTLVARNPLRRSYVQQHGLVARSRLGLWRRKSSIPVRVEGALSGQFDLVIVAVQRPQIESLIPVLADNPSRQIMFMFNCASGADRWADKIGPERQLWGFPAMLADMRGQVVEFAVVPSWMRFAQITTIGRHDGAITPEVQAIRQAFTDAGIPTVASDKMDAWLKTHVAYMATLMAMGYSPRTSRIGPRFSPAQATFLAEAMQLSFAVVEANGVELTPANMRFLARLPRRVLAALLWVAFTLPMTKRSLASHSGAAPEEVATLLDELTTLGQAAAMATGPVAELAAGVPNE